MADDSQDAARANGEYIEALRFVRAVYEPPVDDVTFEWSELKAKALAVVVIETLKATAKVFGRSTPAEIDEHVTSHLDTLIASAMLNPFDGGSGA